MTMDARPAPLPVVLIVDDEPQVLNAIERDLRRHFRADYRVIKAGSGKGALEVAEGLKQRNTPIALFLAPGTFAGISLEGVLAEAAAAMSEAHDPQAQEMALLASFAAFGWKMAL